ncbi:MAG TPA: ATPase, T2SS/T4P/T4SS family, partial [Methylomirabilota bacterium]|nr:ATPase, T2SS/T4P/T4SS family [Methylomirabilota bacterium]
MARLDAFFKLMFDSGASDLHITSGQPPILRVHGELERVKYDPLDDETLRAMLYEIAPEQKIKQFEETGDVDFGYEIPGVARFRANYFMQKYGCGAVFRQIPTKVLTADELGLPPILKKTGMLHKGLVLVTGPTGSGKSTTLAAMVNHVNENEYAHILTIEDPIEFVHESRKCL